MPYPLDAEEIYRAASRTQGKRARVSLCSSSCRRRPVARADSPSNVRAYLFDDLSKEGEPLAERFLARIDLVHFGIDGRTMQCRIECQHVLRPNHGMYVVNLSRRQPLGSRIAAYEIPLFRKALPILFSLDSNSAVDRASINGRKRLKTAGCLKSDFGEHAPRRNRMN